MSFLAQPCTQEPTPDGEVHSDLSHLAHDPKLVGKIMRKRQEELQRRIRLQDPRKRQLGVPHDVLDGQMEEKRYAGEGEAAEDAYYAKSMLFQDQVLNGVEVIKQQMTRDKQKEVTDYSLTHLRKEQRREFALSDPTAMKRELPSYMGENLGPSSMQVFASDCLDPGAKKKLQQADIKETLMAQIYEKEERAQAEKEMNKLYDEHMFFTSQVATMCEEQTLDDMKANKLAEAAENQALAVQHRERRLMREQRELDLKMQHAAEVQNSDRMKETHDYKVGSDGRLTKGDYKRLTVEEEQDNYNHNAYLVLQNQARRKWQNEQDNDGADQLKFSTDVQNSLEAEKQRQRQEKLQQMVAHNKSMAETKRVMDVKERSANKSFVYEHPS